MAWGDNDPSLTRAPAAAPAAPGWGDRDPALTAARPAKKKTSQSLGFMEEFANALGKAPDNPLDLIPGLDARPAREAARRGTDAYFADREKTERPGMVGKVMGDIAGSAPVLAVTRNPWLVGAGQGAITSHAKDAAGIALDAAKGAILNKASGAAMDKLGEVAAPVIDPAVRMLKDAGVRLTPGQIRGGKAMVREDKAMSQPRVGEQIAADRTQGIADFNRGAVNRALLPLGVRLPDQINTGHEAVDFMQQTVKAAYDKITPNLTLKPDGRLAAGFRNAMKVAADLPEREADVFQKVVGNNLRWGPNGDMSGRPLAVALRDLRTKASGYSRSGSEAERQLGQALSHIDDAVHSSLGAQNPGYAKALKATNRAYRGDRIVSDAAKGADEGIASTGQFKASVKANDRTKNQRATAAGNAYLQDYSSAGRKVLPAKTPDSGTAGRVQSDKLLPNIRGAVDAVGYKANKAYSDFLLKDRPAIVKKLGGLLHDYSSQGGLVAGGLLGGLFPDE